MSAMKTIGAFFFVVGIAFLLWVFSAGITVILENQSGKQIHNVEIKYSRGEFVAKSLLDNEVREKFLGKIGEGSNFDIQWRDDSGMIRQAKFDVYFYGFSGFNTIKIRILPNGKIELYEDERLYKPKTPNQRNT